LTVGASRDDDNIRGVLDGGNDACREDKLLPGLADVNDVDTCFTVNRTLTLKEMYSIYLRTVSTTLPNVRLHLLVAVLGSQMSLGREEELDVLIGGVQRRGIF
jgi:hypothetical protein